LNATIEAARAGSADVGTAADGVLTSATDPTRQIEHLRHEVARFLEVVWAPALRFRRPWRCSVRQKYTTFAYENGAGESMNKATPRHEEGQMPTLATNSAVGLTFDASSSVALSPQYYANMRSAAPNEADVRTSTLLWDDVRDEGDDLASAKGLVFGCILGAVMWVPVIAYVFG
jgi:hypothetical protein